MLRHGRRSRSPLRSITTPQHSPGYSATACALMRAYSSGVRIIERESRAAAPRQGRPAPRQGRNDRDLVAVLQRGRLPLQRLDGLAVDVEIHVVMYFAFLVAREAFRSAETPLLLVVWAAH